MNEMHEVPTLSLASGVRTSSLMLVYLSIFSKSSLSSSFMVRLPTYKSVEDTHSLSCSSCFIFKKKINKKLKCYLWSKAITDKHLLIPFSSTGSLQLFEDLLRSLSLSLLLWRICASVAREMKPDYKFLGRFLWDSCFLSFFLSFTLAL